MQGLIGVFITNNNKYQKLLFHAEENMFNYKPNEHSNLIAVNE